MCSNEVLSEKVDNLSGQIGRFSETFERQVDTLTVGLKETNQLLANTREQQVANEASFDMFQRTQCKDHSTQLKAYEKKSVKVEQSVADVKNNLNNLKVKVAGIAGALSLIIPLITHYVKAALASLNKG